MFKVSTRSQYSGYCFNLIFHYFQTIGDQLPLVSFDEFYIHTNRAEINKAQAITRWLKMD